MTANQARAVGFLGNAQVLTLSDGAFVKTRTFHGIHGDPDDLAVSLDWVDHRGCEWAVEFSEQNLDDAEFTANRIQLEDTHGEKVSLEAYLLTPDSL